MRRDEVRARSGRPAPQWLLFVAMGVVVWWSQTAVCDGGPCERAVLPRCTAGPRGPQGLADLQVHPHVRESLAASGFHSPSTMAAFAVGLAATGPGGLAAGRTACGWPAQAHTPEICRTPWAGSSRWSSLGPSLFPLRKRTCATTGLHLSLSSPDDDEEMKTDYRRADEDGSRIFLSGLSPSVDEKRLILAMQSFEGVVQVKLAKPGLGFGLFKDAASAEVAMDSLQGAKLGGKPLTVRRARSFYIQQQQQATLRANVEQRTREHGGVPSHFDLQRRTEQVADAQLNSSPAAAPLPVVRRRKTTPAAGQEPDRPVAAGSRPRPGSRSEEARPDSAGADPSEDEQEWIFKEEERIRSQAMREIMMEGDHKKVRRRRRIGGELVDLPRDADPEPVARFVSGANTAKLVKERMDEIKKRERLKREWREQDLAEASSSGAGARSSRPRAGAGAGASSRADPVPISRSAAAQRAYDILKTEVDISAAAESRAMPSGAVGGDVKGGVRSGQKPRTRPSERGVSLWDDDDDDEEGQDRVLGAGRSRIEDEDEDDEDDVWGEFASVDREYDDDGWDEKDDGATNAQVEKSATGPWEERDREDWNEWKDEQDDDLEDLYRDDEDDLLPGAPSRVDRGRGASKRAAVREAAQGAAPAGTSFGQIANFAGARSGAAPRQTPPATARPPAGAAGAPTGRSPVGASGGGTPLDSDLFSMLSMEDDEFDSLFGPQDAGDSANPLAAEIAQDAIFSERGRRGSSQVPPGKLAEEDDGYWGAGEDQTIGIVEGEAGVSGDDPGQLLKGLLGGSGLETVGQDWNEEEDWDDDDDEFLAEADGAVKFGAVDDDDDEDAFLSQFDTHEDVENGIPLASSLDNFGDGSKSSENSDEESILDKLRARNPEGAAALDLDVDAESRQGASEEKAGGGARSAQSASETEGGPTRDLDAIFGARPAQPSSKKDDVVAPGGGIRRGVPPTVTAQGKSSVAPSNFAPAEKASPPDWWLKGGDQPPPLVGQSLEAVPDLEDEEAAADAEEAGEGGEDFSMTFGQVAYNGKEMEERRILETAAEKLLASMDGDDESAKDAAQAEYLDLLERANASDRLNRRLGGNLEPPDALEEDAALSGVPEDDDGDEGVDKFLEATMFGFVNGEGGDAAVYDTLMEEINDDGLEGGDSRVGWPAPADEGSADGDAEDPTIDKEAVATGDSAVDVTSTFRQQVEKSRWAEQQPDDADATGAFVAAFEAKALKRGPSREDVFEADALLQELQEAMSNTSTTSGQAATALGPALPGRKSMDAKVLQAMMAKVSQPSAAADAPPSPGAPLATNGRREEEAVDDVIKARAKGTSAAAEPGEGTSAAPELEEQREDEKLDAVEEHEEGRLEEEMASLLTSPVPVEFMNSLGLLSKSSAAALPSNVPVASEGSGAGNEQSAAAHVMQQLQPITGAVPPGCSGSVMTYNALVSVLQQRVDSRLESLMGKIDAQALAARREMLLTQLTPEAIALTCLTDVLEKKIVPMQDTVARLGPRMRDVDLGWEYKERLWALHDRLQNDFKYRMLFVPSYVRQSWQRKKESIRAGSLEVRAVTLRRRRNANARKEEERSASKHPGGQVTVAQEDDDAEIASRASTAWEKLKERARQQRPGSRTFARGGGGSATLTNDYLVSDDVSDPGVRDVERSGRPQGMPGTPRPEAAASPSSPTLQESGLHRSAAVNMRSDASTSEKGVSGVQAGGAQALSGVASSALPISEDMSLADIRRFIRDERLEQEVKTSGAGRTKAAILQDVARIWLSRS